MALGTSLFLIAAGAVLRFAVSVSTHGFSIHTIGVILMVVGGIGLLISLLWMAMWRERQVARSRRYGRRDVPPPETY